MKFWHLPYLGHESFTIYSAFRSRSPSFPPGCSSATAHQLPLGSRSIYNESSGPSEGISSPSTLPATNQLLAARSTLMVREWHLLGSTPRPPALRESVTSSTSSCRPACVSAIRTRSSPNARTGTLTEELSSTLSATPMGVAFTFSRASSSNKLNNIVFRGSPCRTPLLCSTSPSLLLLYLSSVVAPSKPDMISSLVGAWTLTTLTLVSALLTVSLDTLLKALSMQEH